MKFVYLNNYEFSVIFVSQLAIPIIFWKLGWPGFWGKRRGRGGGGGKGSGSSDGGAQNRPRLSGSGRAKLTSSVLPSHLAARGEDAPPSFEVARSLCIIIIV